MDVLPIKHKKTEKTPLCNKYFDKKELSICFNIKAMYAMTVGTIHTVSIALNAFMSLNIGGIDINPDKKEEECVVVETNKL